ncbi:MAG: glutamine--fructose-6-phosphate transaminase (isomerizing) [Bacteroidaceae bacterium]|nr:glutamine--fructose-6-phosphate transaminase (isomerizing) [Bacteroidaceae bacterium]
MCGIVGYIGKRKAYPILINGLKRLEYRGYDSSGVALISNTKKLNVYKAKGKVAVLEAETADKDITGTIGIAHTRWATHGVPSVVNAHPHKSQSGNIAVVHNGIIENYAELKADLIEKGFKFVSETDTEVVAQLIEYLKESNNCTLGEAVRVAMRIVIGAYAICVIEQNDPDTIIVARQSSPLVIGIGENNSEFFIASDASPIAEYTTNMVYLNDGEVATLHRDKKIKIVDLENYNISPQIKKVELNMGQLEKGGFPHFMLKEIFDQPACLSDCMRGRLLLDEMRVKLSAVELHEEKLKNADKIIIVACGTSWHAALIGKQLFEEMCNVPVMVEYASEFRYGNPIINSHDVVIAISQSGETADTLAAIQLAKSKGALVFGIVNAVGSSIARTTDAGTYIHVGPEIGVASTKAFTGQVTLLTLVALALGKAKNTISEEDYDETLKELARIPAKMQKLLKQSANIEQFSKVFTYAKNFLYLGRGYNYPVALEGALKLKEISYIHAEGYPAAEMKHGPIALVDAEMPVVVIATHQCLYEKIISNIQEVKARNGRIIAIVTEGDETVKKIADICIEIPETLNRLSPLLAVIPLQLLAYYVAVQKGLNVDQPRNLAKSVTVE